MPPSTSPISSPPSTQIAAERLREWALECGVRILLPARAAALMHGEPSHHAFYLERGVALITRTKANGTDVTVAIRRAGAFLGLAAAVHEAPHPASAIMKTDGCVVAVPAARVRSGLARPDVGPPLALELASEVLGLVERCVRLTTLDVRERVEHVLHDAATASDQPLRQVPLTASEIALLVASDASHVYRILRAMSREGRLDLARGRIRIKSREPRQAMGTRAR
jgi:CRP-like cAMP-binding protein